MAPWHDTPQTPPAWHLSPSTPAGMKNVESSSGVKTELVASRDRHREALPDPTSPPAWCPGQAAWQSRDRMTSRAGDNVPIPSVPTVPSVSLPAKGAFPLPPSLGYQPALPPALGWQWCSGKAKGRRPRQQHFLCLRDTQKRGFPIPPPLLQGRAVACAAPMPPTGTLPTGMPQAPRPPPSPGGSTPENPCAASSQGTGGGCNLWLLAGITPARRRAQSPASTGTAAPATGFGTEWMPAPVSEQGMR